MNATGCVLVGAAIILLAPSLWLLDRLGLWLEEHGWLFYRRRKPTSSPLSCFVAVQQIIEPGVRHVRVAGEERRVEDANGDAGRRLLTCLRDVLQQKPVNLEAVRIYLEQARREGLAYEDLYAEATRDLPEGEVPPLVQVAPIE